MMLITAMLYILLISLFARIECPSNLFRVIFSSLPE